jgi:hypothetical protein
MWVPETLDFKISRFLNLFARAKVPGHGGKSYFDDQEVMEDRPLDIIRVREQNRR